MAKAARAAGLTGLEASTLLSASGTPAILRHTTKIGIKAQPKPKDLMRRLFS